MSLLIPNSTQVPNYLLDEVMPSCNPAEWKVISFICRKTFGWRKTTDRISLSQFEEGTGLSRKWLVIILDRLTARGLLQRDKTTKGDVYSLNLQSGVLSTPVQEPKWCTEYTKTGVLSSKTGVLSTPTKETNTKLRNLRI